MVEDWEFDFEVWCALKDFQKSDEIAWRAIWMSLARDGVEASDIADILDEVISLSKAEYGE